MNEALQTLGEYIAGRRPDCVTEWWITNGDLTIEVPPASLEGFVEFLRADASCQFTQLIDVTAVDHPEREKRFTVVYHFLSMRQNQRVCVHSAVREDESIATLTGLFPSANWYEREVFDMYGIGFPGHPDLKRILLPDDADFHALLKDFGRIEDAPGEQAEGAANE